MRPRNAHYLKMPWGDTLDLQVLTSVTGQLQHLGSEVLEDSSRVDSSGGTHSLLSMDSALQKPVDTTDRELHKTEKKEERSGTVD